MDFCLEDNHLSDEMSVASGVSYYSSSSAEEPMRVPFAHEIYNEEEDSLKTAINGIYASSSEESLLSGVKKTALEYERLFADLAPLTSNGLEENDEKTAVSSTSTAVLDLCTAMSNMNTAASNVNTAVSNMSTAITGSISCYSMPPSETEVELVDIMNNEPIADTKETLCSHHNVVNSVDIQKPTNECLELHSEFVITESVDRYEGEEMENECDTAIEA